MLLSRRRIEKLRSNKRSFVRSSRTKRTNSGKSPLVHAYFCKKIYNFLLIAHCLLILPYEKLPKHVPVKIKKILPGKFKNRRYSSIYKNSS